MAPASAGVKPCRSGTVVCFRPAEQKTFTVSPCTTFWPPTGSVEITRPEAMVLLFWLTFFTLKFWELKLVATLPQDLSTRPLGTWTIGAPVLTSSTIFWFGGTTALAAGAVPMTCPRGTRPFGPSARNTCLNPLSFKIARAWAGESPLTYGTGMVAGVPHQLALRPMKYTTPPSTTRRTAKRAAHQPPRERPSCVAVAA